MKVLFCRLLGWFTRNFPVPNKFQFIRFFYDPDKRSDDYFECIAPYQSGKIHINTSIFLEWHIFFHGYYEKELTEFIRERIKKDSVCLDIGANIGCHSLTMAFLAPEGKVLSFEPHPENYRRLEQNIALNNLSNIRPFNLAISNQSGNSTIYEGVPTDPNKAKCSLLKSEERGVTCEIEIECSTVSDLDELKQLTRIDFIKIDVEGYEMICLEQLKELIEKHNPLVVFEYDEKAWGLASADLKTALNLFPAQYKFSILEKAEKLASDFCNLPESGNIVCIYQNSTSL